MNAEWRQLESALCIRQFAFESGRLGARDNAAALLEEANELVAISVSSINTAKRNSADED